MPPPPFQDFLDAHRTPVHRFLLASVGRQDAEDCFQETFLAALRAYPRLDGRGDLKAWVFTIAHRKALDHHRARRRRPQPAGDLPEPADPRAGPPEPRDDALWAAVHELPAKQRGAVLLRFVADLSHAEIGAALGCSEEAARSNVHEGLKRLRKEHER